MGLSYTLAFIGGFGDAAGFVLARTFTGHVTGNLVLAAVSLATLDWATTLTRLFAVLSFLAGILLSVVCARLATGQRWPPLAAAFAVEIVLIAAGSLLLLSHARAATELFVLCLSLALGLQNGAFRQVGGVSVHTTYLTGMLTGLVVSQTERLLSQPDGTPTARDQSMRLIRRVWLTFFVGAATGAVLTVHFRETAMLMVLLLLGALVIYTLQRRSVLQAENRTS
jgi:uncharacterized membrane protein YoaK (UPF0700 family)